VLFKEQSKSFQVFKTLAIENIFFETDDTDYSIEDIYLRAGDIRNIPMEALQQQIIQNFNRCFAKNEKTK
jgi:TatD DNase family protein